MDIRAFARDKHKKTDDSPYGGGPGMVMKPEPVFEALASLGLGDKSARPKTKRVVLLAPRGEQFDQKKAGELSGLEELTLICGRYEGVDQRVADHMADAELSIGPYVISGGEAAAMVVTEAVARLVPGVIGNPDSLAAESHSLEASENELGEYPQYTRPEEFRDWKVPDTLLSGDHGEIAKWRKTNIVKKL